MEASPALLRDHFAKTLGRVASSGPLLLPTHPHLLFVGFQLSGLKIMARLLSVCTCASLAASS